MLNLLFGIGELFLFFMAAVGSLIFHEAGHIAATRAFHAKSIQLLIGAGKSMLSFNFGRLRVMVQRIFFMNFVTLSYREKAYTPKEQIIISFMGPVFSILLAIIFYVMYQTIWSVSWVFLGCLFNLWLGISNIIPFKIGQKASDGYTIYKIFTSPK